MPCYNEGGGLAPLHERIATLAAKLKQAYGLSTEVVYVDDGSRDDTLTVAQSLPATTLDVNVISLSRNFGKEAALMAGLDHARRGNAVLFMDGDGQHPPALVETLVRHWIEDGYDVVYTAKAHRKNEAMLLRMAVRGFYSLMNYRARHKIPPDAGDFRLLSPRAAAALRQLPERNRFFKGLSSWIGFKQLRVDYQPEAARARPHVVQPGPADRPVDRRHHLVFRRPVAGGRHAGGADRICLVYLRPDDPVGDLRRRQIGARLRLGHRRRHGARRNAACDDRRSRRIYRQDHLRAEGPAGVFRGREDLEARR